MVNLRLTSPATRTHLAGSLDASYMIADGASGLVFMQASPHRISLSEAERPSTNYTPIRPNDYSEPQYLSAAKNQANALAFKREGRMMSDADILAAVYADPGLKGQLSAWLSAQGVKTDYVLALEAAASNPGGGTDTGGTGTGGTGTGGTGTTPVYPTIASAPLPTLAQVTAGATLVTGDGKQYKAGVNPRTGQFEWTLLR